MLLMAVTLQAQNAVEHNGIWYLLDDEALTAKVSFQGWSPDAHKEYSGHVAVPAKITYNDKTYDVVTIDSGAFEGNDGLTSVTLPESIKEIGWSSFENCTGLTSIELPNSLEIIKFDAFNGCTGLKSIMFGTGLKTIYATAFMNCNAVEIIICKATTPPTMGIAFPDQTEEIQHPDMYVVFENVDCSQIPVYVPGASVAKYSREDQWKDFKFIKAYDAETIVIDEEAKATAAENSVDIEWQAVDDAVTYIIELRHNNELICTMTFNAEGTILSATYAAPARDKAGNKVPAAVQTASGWKYTVDGLDANSEYTYTVTAKDSEDGVVYTKTGSFTTQASTGIESVQHSAVRGQKIIRDGMLLIEKNGKTFNATGVEVK